jgi:hypothetical protein
MTKLSIKLKHFIAFSAHFWSLNTPKQVDPEPDNPENKDSALSKVEKIS